MAKIADFVKAYIGAVGARSVVIRAGPTECCATFSLSDDSNLDILDALWFSKAAHAELVVMNCHDDFLALGAERPDGVIGLSARAVRDHVINVAAGLGASWRTIAEMKADALIAVEEIIEHVEHQRRIGGLAKVNASYKIYRQAQTAKGEKAVPYASHLGAFTMSLVVLAAQNAKAI
jgi:hypothetical protein